MAPRTRRIDPRDRHHIENIEEQEEVTFDMQKTRATTRKTQKTGLSYGRPNREYTKKTKWSEAMNKNRVATNLENMENLENSGNLKNCQNLRENPGKFELL